MSYGAKDETRVGLDGIEPVDFPHVARASLAHEGALPLSYRPLAAAPGFEPGPSELTARRATVLRHAAVEERKGFGPLRQRTCADLPG